MNPLEKLMQEHQNIIEGIEKLERAASRLERGEEVSPEFFRRAIDFIRNYADRYHHAKEEDILFVRMGEIGFSPEMGPVAVMLHEHNLGRQYVAGLETATERYAAGDRDAIKDIIDNALGFAETLRQHIHKEDTILYPMAQSALGEMGINLMRPDFERVEQERSGFEEKYLALLRQLEVETISVGS